MFLTVLIALTKEILVSDEGRFQCEYRKDQRDTPKRYDI